MLNTDKKSKIIADFQMNEKDTGSSAVQVALLTDRINHLNAHLKKEKKDYATNRGLMKLVGRRRRLLSYVKRNSEVEYKNLITRLGLRK